MQKKWLLAEAKNKLSEVLNLSLKEPQFIQRRQDQVVLLSRREYERLLEIEKQQGQEKLGNSQQPKSLKYLLMNPPVNNPLEDELDEVDEFVTHITRSQNGMGEVDFDINFEKNA